MPKKRNLPNLFAAWPGNEKIRETVKHLAEAVRDQQTFPPDLPQRVRDCPPLPEEFGCHVPSLTLPEQQALIHKLGHETDQGEGRWRFLSDDFLVRIAPPRKPADRLPELHFPERGWAGLHVNLLRAWFLHALGGLPAVKEDLLGWLRSRDGATDDLGRWAERFGINLSWVLDDLVYIARTWRMDYGDGFESAPPEPSRLVWRVFPDGGLDPMAVEPDYQDRCRFTLTFSWFPTMESRAVAERRLMAELLTVAQYHLDRIERMHRERGYVGTRGVWNPAALQYVQEHCEQLVLYQCAGITFEELAERYPAAKRTKPKHGTEAFDRERDRVKTIRVNVERLAAQIGLPLRSE